MIVVLVVAGYFVFRSDGTPKVSSTPTVSATPIASPSVSASVTPSVSPSVTPSKTPTPTPTRTPTATPSSVVVVPITASNFKYSTSQIKVKKGDTVKIVLANTGGTHDWVIDEFNARTKIITSGETAEITFVANKTGSFEYYCSIGTHRAMGMKGMLIVE